MNMAVALNRFIQGLELDQMVTKFVLFRGYLSSVWLDQK